MSSKTQKHFDIAFEDIMNVLEKTDAFDREDLVIYTDPKNFKEYIFNLNLENSVLLLMSSGNYGGLNFDEIKILIDC